MHRVISLLSILAILALVSLSPGFNLSPVAAQSEIQITKVASSDNATLDDTITYTYTISNGTGDNLTDLKLVDDKLGTIPLPGDNATATSLAAGENITAMATYKVALSDLLAGSIKNTATVTGTDAGGNMITASSGEVRVSTSIIRSLLTKAQVLRLSGVPGKGLESAPGLQKQFNPNSQAGGHAGKKDGRGNVEKHKNQEMNGNVEQHREQETHHNRDNGRWNLQ